MAQLYLRDDWAQVARPVKELVGFARVALEPGQSKRVVLALHADRTSFTGIAGKRIVEPGSFTCWVGPSSSNLPLEGSSTITGQVRRVGPGRVLSTPATII